MFPVGLLMILLRIPGYFDPSIDVPLDADMIKNPPAIAWKLKIPFNSLEKVEFIRFQTFLTLTLFIS
jgi:hypothetical protein